MKVTYTEVPASERLAFFPKLFGTRMMMAAEAMVYDRASELSINYRGGLWSFYTLSNGGFYMAPQSPERLAVLVRSNDFECEVSADAFGLIVSLFVLGALCWIEQEELREKFATHFYQLRDFALEHEEASVILRAID
ncbi:antirestriction protein [Paraburkholderia phymatum]|uniref:Antirestriction protein n=1 Tax=Paraburkholderia phymatum (strain DSM 17167 / CIP 108236 / LMG 21445 / STM815) TaxID=391038 RepID=B2JKZ9_PARP8|nr:antirestriction protein [Paraburkholderia phymatum]ACC72528.1 Antirestriction protein [Paraburkholderia phymatum STM815]